MRLLLPCFALVACVTPTDSAGEAGDDYEHEVVPEDYRGQWDEESSSCPDVIFYWAFEGEISDSGKLTGEESWYWFFADEGAETDCVDTFEVKGEEEPTPVTPDSCVSCDRDFTASYEMTDKNCNWDGYEQLLDDDDTDRIDEESYTLAFMLDYDNGMGEPLEQANVWSYAQDDRSESDWVQRAISIGEFEPSGSDLRGAGSVRWAIGEGVCVTIEEEEGD